MKGEVSPLNAETAWKIRQNVFCDCKKKDTDSKKLTRLKETRDTGCWMPPQKLHTHGFALLPVEPLH